MGYYEAMQEEIQDAVNRIVAELPIRCSSCGEQLESVEISGEAYCSFSIAIDREDGNYAGDTLHFELKDKGWTVYCEECSNPTYHDASESDMRAVAMRLNWGD